ncbi:TUG ubiquitin-like domain [Trinorchestia longiramus]|nr:TUG ubiquitin-like domain [Trinorchestia longiramus]
MSNQSVTVLCPNARRVVVKTSPNTSLLQILEQACAKQNYDADLYTLKHLQRSLDISSMLRFAGLPNRCVLEMQELAVPRQQQQITVCVTDAGGAKHVTQHLPNVLLVLGAKHVTQHLSNGECCWCWGAKHVTQHLPNGECCWCWGAKHVTQHLPNVLLVLGELSMSPSTCLMVSAAGAGGAKHVTQHLSSGKCCWCWGS